MHKNSTIIFPQGGGGAWLSNLIYNLETHQSVMPTCSVDFDSLPRSSIKFSHRFVEHADNASPAPVTMLVENLEDNIVFSNRCAFNHYLNDVRKLRYNQSRQSNIANLAIQTQFTSCVNSAMYLTTDPLYRKSYYEKIDLDHQLIFYSAAEFVDQLFAQLDQLVDYCPDRVYAMASIKHYRTTCGNPVYYIDCCHSLIWLAWAAGVCQALGIEIESDLSTMTTIEDLAARLRPYRDPVLDYTNKHAFSWES